LFALTNSASAAEYAVDKFHPIPFKADAGKSVSFGVDFYVFNDAYNCGSVKYTLKTSGGSQVTSTTIVLDGSKSSYGSNLYFTAPSSAGAYSYSVYFNYSGCNYTGSGTVGTFTLSVSGGSSGGSGNETCVPGDLKEEWSFSS